ncbi:MAG: hypothetical protein KIT72_16055 [Polyangiaceae bacterium]|nr:hypothetical protein [Polyangiaceae bacterium]MCW5791931.1 hypothetical protein [Polyangiaceae bacterium]
MNSAFLCGVIAAWALAKLAVGSFFILTYAQRRRDAEYLLFGLLCFAVAVVSAGISLAYGADGSANWQFTSRLSHTGAIAAGALNLHFVVRYTRAPYLGWVKLAYVLAALFTAVNLSGHWFQPGTDQTLSSEVLGKVVTHLVAEPTPFGAAFYLVTTLQLGFGFWLIGAVFARGQREAGWVMVGASVLVLTFVNDVLLTTGTIPSVYLVPGGFLIYVFSIGATLPVRYRTKEQELEAVTSDLAVAAEELRSSYVELQVVQDQLSGKEQLAQVGELAAAIAHEVRNPLAVIVNACASLRRPQLAEDDRTMLLGIVEEEAGRLNRLVTDLLRFARPMKVNRSPVAMMALLQRAEARLSEGVELTLDISDDPEVQTLWVDAGLLPLVFENLVSNACQAMPSGGTVHISAALEAVGDRHEVRITLSDSGHGMDEDVIERAVDPFFTTRPSGTGLGLPIVERVIKGHGGSLDIVSRPGHGTDVVLRLPVRREGEEEFPPRLQRLIDAARRRP